MTHTLLRAVVTGAAVSLFATPLLAQPAPFFFPLVPGSVTVTKDVQYGRADTTTLNMDVYRPANTSGAAPVLVLFNVAVGAQRANDFYVGWARGAASRGIVTIVPDLHGAQAERDFQLLIDHLYERAASYGGDREAIAVYAGSATCTRRCRSSKRRATRR
jgi:acetyl esterase/lipase